MQQSLDFPVQTFRSSERLYQHLAEAVGTLVTAATQDDLWHYVAEACRLLLQAERTAVFRYDPIHNKVTCPFHAGLSKHYINYVQSQFENLPSMSVLTLHEPLTVHDVRRHSVLRQYTALYEAEDIRSMGFFPMLNSNDTLGFIAVYHERPYAFSNDELHIGQTLSHITGQTLRNLLLLHESEEALARERQLNAIVHTLNSSLDLPHILQNLVEMTAQLIGADRGLLGIRIEEDVMTFYPHNVPSSMELKPAIRGRGVAWQIVNTAVPVVTDNYLGLPGAQGKWAELEITSFLGVPLLSANDCLGALTLFNCEPGRPFTQRDLELAKSVGQQAAATIENARLFAAARQRANTLATALAQKEELDKLKTHFIHSVSHELRAPLNIVFGHAELLESGFLGKLDAAQQQSAATIARRAHMLVNLVDDLTALLAAETQEFRRDLINPALLVQSVTAEYQIKANEQDVQLTAVVPDTIGWLHGDKTHLNRVFDNLLSNAFKFTPAGGTICIELTQQDEQIKIAVSDSGEGMEVEQLPRIFDRFYQIYERGKPRRAGTGLGLALVKEIIAAHRGEVQVCSQRGVGSTFTIFLPGYSPPRNQAATIEA